MIIKKTGSTGSMIYFIHLSNKYLLKAYYLPGIDLDIGNTVMDQNFSSNRN